jgi:hypothetical protein
MNGLSANRKLTLPGREILGRSSAQSDKPINIPVHQNQRETLMKNAYQRFGKLVYVRRTEKVSTNIRVHLDAFVGEERGKAHFVSVIGGDVEIGAIAAAFGNGDLFTVIDPTLGENIVSLGDNPLLFRGSLMVAERRRPLRHLVACSQDLAATSTDAKLLLVSSDDTFIWSSLAGHYGLPATPEWGPWMLAELRSHRRIHSLPGFGYQAVAITGTRKQLLALLSRGLQKKNLKFPAQNGPVNWPEIRLAKSI